MGTQVKHGVKLPRVICQKRIKSSRRKKEGTQNSLSKNLSLAMAGRNANF